MQVPKITLRVERGEGRSLSGECLGAALLVLVIMQLMSEAGMQATASCSRAIPRAAYLIGTITILVAFALVDARAHTLFRSTRPVRWASTLTGIGTLLYTISLALRYFSAEPLVADAGLRTAGELGAAGLLDIAAMLCLGVGMGFFSILWGIAFSRMDTVDIISNSTVGTALGVAIYAVSGSLLPKSLGLVVAGILQLSNLWLLRNRVTDNLPDPDMRRMRYFGELQVRRGQFALMIVPTMFAMGAASTTMLMRGEGVLVLGSGIAWAAGTATAVAALGLIQTGFSLWLRSAGRPFRYLFRFMLPIAATLVLPIPVAHQALSLASVSVMCAASVTIALTLGFLAALSQEFRLSPVFVFGLGMGSVGLGAGATMLVASAIAPQLTDLLTPGALSLVVILFCLVVAGGFSPRSGDIRTIVVASFHPREMYGAPEELTDDDEVWAAENTAASRESDALPRSHADTPYAREALDDTERDEVRKGRFVRRVEYVADTFLLSRRETEVLFLLAKGRNVSYISEQLGISEGTAKTHVNHVYKKLDVHSQQQLIGLVDSFDA